MENENIENAIERINNLQKVPETISFVVQDDFVKNLPNILSNIEDIGVWAKQQTEIDRNLILSTDEDFENGKKRCAAIRKIITEIEDRRKAVKKSYNEPYEIFDKEIKEVVKVLTDARENLWGQITKAEQEVKDSIEQTYRHYYETTAEEKGILKYRSWEQVFESKWLNKGKKADSVKEEIDQKIATTLEELSAIKSLNSEFETSLIVKYQEGATLTAIITYNNRLLAEKQATESQKGQVVTNDTEKEEKTEKTANESLKQENETVYSVDFRVYATETQLRALKNFLIENEIKYGEVPKE